LERSAGANLVLWLHYGRFASDATISDICGVLMIASIVSTNRFRVLKRSMLRQAELVILLW